MVCPTDFYYCGVQGCVHMHVIWVIEARFEHDGLMVCVVLGNNIMACGLGE